MARTLKSRREFLRDAVVTAATIGAAGSSLPYFLTGKKLSAKAHAAPTVASSLPSPQGSFETPHAGKWKSWVLSSGGEIPLPRPAAPASAQGRMELEQLRQAQLERSDVQINAARFWDTGPATQRWTEIHLEMIKTHRPNPPRAARGLALAHIAMYDALVAAWYTKYLYKYPAPGIVDSVLTAAVNPRDNPSYPSEHAVAAGAASRVLAYLFPEQGAQWFEGKATEAAHSRLWAGADWPSSIEQGLALGRAVAERLLARAALDGSGAQWDGKRPTGVCYWKPTPPGLVFPPLEPSWGKVKPWLLTSADQLRPGPPPLCGSAAEREQYLEVYRVGKNLTDEQKKIALFWNDGPGTYTPPGHWFKIALDLTARHDLGTMRAARLFAYLGVAVNAAGICGWDAKYAYWTLRPVTYIQDYVDPDWTSFIPTPPFPGYVSGHATFSGAAAEWLGHAFPEERTALRSLAAEAAMSRLYGGIHIRADNQVGLAMGSVIGSVASTRGLIDDVEDLAGKGALDRGEAGPMMRRLEGTIARVNQRNFKGAIADLQAFIGQVNGLLKPADAEPLTTAAKEILAHFAAMA